MATSPLEPGQIVAGRYRVDSQIGVGGMGVVYLVHHVHTDEKLALKVLHARVLKDEAAVERFRREARAPAKVASEHVARVTDADTAAELGGAPFYVMEYLQGDDLEKMVVRDGPIAPELVVEYLRQAARALDKAHGMGIVHRDLKPENLFLTRRDDDTPCIKLLDFGIARLSESELPEHLKTQAGAMFGTPAFMSPEQMEGDLERVGPAADVWALGLIAFKLLVGTDFWTGTTVAVLCAQVLSIPIPTPTIRGSKYGPQFDEWFATCSARDIGARYKSAGEAVRALASALGVAQEIGRRSALSMVDAATELGPGLDAVRDEAFATRAMTSPGPLATIHGVAPPQPGLAARGPQPSHPGAFAPSPSSSGGGVGMPEAALHVSLDAPTGGTIAPTSRSKDGSGRRLRVRAFVAVIGLVLVASGIIVALVMPGAGTTPASTPPSTTAALDAAPSAPVLIVPGATAEPAAPLPSGSVASAPSASAASGSAPTGRNPGGSSPPGEPRPPSEPPGQPSSPATTAPPPPPAETPKAPSKGNSGAPTSDQKKRLSSLQRLCDQGIFTPAECAAKRAAILAQ